MAYDKEQEDFPLPAGNNNSITSATFLPKYFRTDTNRKFLGSTVDQMIQPGVVEKINSFVGRRYSVAATTNDSYLPDFTVDRENYQFEPVSLYKDELGNVEFYKDYNDYIGQIKNFKGSASNHSILNSQEFYSWDPHIDWDKFTNFREYYWLPIGPVPVDVVGQTREVVSTYSVSLIEDADNFAYVFSTDEFPSAPVLRNPTVKLYKGQTYRFEINTLGHPFSIAILRTFLDNDPTVGTDFVNQSTLYKKGVVVYTRDVFGNLIETTDEYIETGVIEFTVPDDAPEALYYISKNDVNVSGIFSVNNIVENSFIDVEKEIVGKKTYKTSSGVELSNGMKLSFKGLVTPATYSEGYFYVEGVGNSIQLVAEQDLEVPAIFTTLFEIPFDGENFGFDQYPYEDATSFPGTKDYIVINRVSADRNPWARYNRWFHRSLIEASFAANNLPVVIDEDARAKRPIIEFEAGLKLFNHGTKAKKNVNLIDTYTTDVFSTVEGSLGYNVDQVDLVDGMRVIFAADTDILVNGKIYEVRFITHNGRRQISLVETEDSAPATDDAVLILDGIDYKGKMFWYNGTQWKQSQEKTSVNQAPTFDLFDKDENSFNDNLVYPANNFRGNKVFSYKVGTGTADSELGFSLTYRNITNVGDIVFEFNLLSESVEYQIEPSGAANIFTDVGYLKKYNSAGTDFVYVNGWKKAIANSKQAVVRQYNVSSQVNNFRVDVYNNSGSLTDLFVKVFINGTRKELNKDFTIQNINGFATVVLTVNATVDDIVLLKCYSAAPKNSKGFYEVPINFEKNPLNENITTFTLGEVNDHVESIIEEVAEYTGSFPGISNLRDLGNVTAYGQKFVQHSGTVNLSLYHMTDKNSNIIKSIRYARKEYAKFKRKFLYEAEKTGFHGPVKDHVDLILSTIKKDFISSRPFYFGDMIGFGAARKTIHTIEYNGPAYFALSQNFNLTSLSTKAVNVYLNSEQLLHERDYTFTDSFVYVTLDLQDGDLIEVYEYESTNGLHIPPTPTKIGLYPKYHPVIIEDNTYATPRRMIQGHDGSLTLAFDDYRDELILELEYRIFNNIKTQYNTDLVDINDFVPSISRSTGFSITDINRAMTADFSQWLDIAGNPNFAEHNFWNNENSFTFNYSRTTDKDSNPLTGYWRSIYKFYYDTDRPHTNPWEMIGFTIKPTWWESVYGAAPYTKDNLVLWRDLSQGIVREPGKAVIRNKKYQRLDLLTYIPVDEYGRLLSPLESNIAKNFILTESKNVFTFGDQAPVETAWRRSSEYPFSLLTAWILLQPSKIIGLGYDYSRTERDLAGNIIYKDTQKRIALSDLVFPAISLNDTLNLTSGLVNYVSNYMASRVAIRYTDYKEQLTNLTNQLAIKLGGFTDKSKLKLVLDSRSPLNKSSVFVPDENYQVILNTSSPLETAVLSGIIIEKTESGYVISGYDKEDPVFNYYTPKDRTVDPSITVGGISEKFVEWDSGKDYVSGLVVLYNAFYYRTKITHTSTDEFDSTKFVKLAELPIVGGLTAILRRDFETEVSQLVYGSLLESVQDVVDFMLGYEKYLTDSGFKFEFYNTETEAVEDMKLCVKEFMFWVTQNWDNSTVLVVSPVANKVVFEKQYFVVDDIYDSFYEYSILAGDGSKISKDFSNIFRDNSNTFGVKPINIDDGIYLVKLPLVQKEHVILIDNETVFNDVIYDKIPGYRQERIKVVGYRTDNWNGGLNIPGFIYDNAKVKNWSTYTDYAIGDVVKYKEFFYSSNIKHTSDEFFNANRWNRLDERPEPRMLPNWDYKAAQISDFYDLETDNFDTEQERLAQHLIGYQKREYLANIITDSVSQYKFYQGFIQDKGTKNSLTKLFDALSSANTDSLEFYEEWAIRLGQYGAIDNLVEVEYLLDESKYRLEPQIIELVNNISPTRTDLVYEIAPFQAYQKPEDYTHKPFTILNDIKTYTTDNGYVRDQEISEIVNDYDGILQLDIEQYQAGDFFWITNYDQDWTVLRMARTPYNIVGFQNEIPFGFNRDDNGVVVEGITLTIDPTPDFIEGEIIGISTADTDLKGFYKLHKRVADKIYLLTDKTFASDYESPDSTEVAIARFVERRFADANSVNQSIEQLRNDISDKIWIDNKGDGNWGVYTNKNIFAVQDEILNPTEEGDGFSHSFDANASNTVIAISSSSPRLDRDGILRIYTRNIESFTTSFYQAVEPTDVYTGVGGYGFSVSVSPDGKYIAVGAPYASNVQTRFRGDITVGENYDQGDIVRNRGTLWKAKVDVLDWNADSTITDDNQDWESAYFIEATTSVLATASTYTSQGVVYLYERDTSGTYNLSHTICSPNPSTNERFGYRVILKNTLDGNAKLFVGAPGEENVSKGRIYFIDNLSGEWTYTVDRNYKGLYETTVNYYRNNIVFYNGTLRTIISDLIAPTTEVDLLERSVTVSDNNVEYTGFIPRSDIIDGDQDSDFNDAGLGIKNIGEKFDVNAHGDVLVLAAKGQYGVIAEDLTAITERVSIYRKPLDRWQFAQSIDTEDSKEDFAHVISINDAGTKIAIGAPTNDVNGIDKGCVYVYAQSTVNNISTFQIQQTLSSPFDEKNEAFGNGVDFNSNKLAISSKNSDRRIITTFDTYSEILPPTVVGVDELGNNIVSRYVLDSNSTELTNKTTFDSGTTTFMTLEKDVGRIGVFQEIGDYYIYGEDLQYNRNTKYNNISNFKLNDNHIYIGLPKLNPSTTLDNDLVGNYNLTEDSSLGVFADLRAPKNTNSWELLTAQSEKTDLSKIQRVFLYSADLNDILTSVDLIDPRQGKIAGPAEQEITWKTFYDPAIYSNNEENNPSVVVDSSSNWAEENVGKLWWDLSTASWYNSYQGDSQYRISTWNKLIPGASIDVYEWVGTKYTPSEWNSRADSNRGFAEGISGTTKYDNTVYSTKKIYDPVAGSFRTKYYYWVKSKRIVPTNILRSISAFDVEQLIADPAGQGYRFAAIIGEDSFALYNLKNFVEGTNTVLHFTFLKDAELQTNIHSEYQLLTEGLGTSKINSEIEQKWFDSLIGYDINNKTVPDPLLSAKQKYGIFNRPRQSMFINRLEAVKQFVERVNSVLIQYQIVDNFDISNLLAVDEKPSINTGKYDIVVDTVLELDSVGVAKVQQAVLTPIIVNGKITGATIVDPGRGYRVAPNIEIDDNSGTGAILKATINNLGQITSVFVRSSGNNYTGSTRLTVRKFSALVNVDSEIGGRWAIYVWDKLTKTWSRSDNQAFDTTRYWDYVDWYADGYNSLTAVDHVVDQSYELFGTEADIGEIVKINTIGTGGWLLLEKIDNIPTEDYTVNYKTIGRQNGTIQLSTRLYDYATKTSGYDANVFDITFYDREPVFELRNILTALRDDIFIGELETEYNRLFFAGLRYAFAEQPNIDWAFKTSFVRAKHNLGSLAQKVTFQNDNLENYEDYVNEVKPYHTKVREYISSYDRMEPTRSLTTDFDLPPSYNDVTKEIETSYAKLRNGEVVDLLPKYVDYPFKSWLDNNGYDIVRIEVTEPGSGYKETPVVEIINSNGTTAKAYLSKGSVSTIEITNTGDKYYVSPEIVINGSLEENGTPAKAVAILGNSKVRSTHMVIKFDRVTGSYLYTDLSEIETFTGTGAKEKFVLKWPMDLRTNKYSVYVNGILQLSSKYTVGNDKDTTKTYNRLIGYVEFVDAPAIGATVEIRYEKSVAMLTAADRINFFYNPTTGMAGKDLAQLMDGIEYSGVKIDTYGFGTEQGFDSAGFASLPWDTFDNQYEDEIFVLDGSTNTFELSQPLENDVEYNLYLNGVRLDDPNFETSGVVTNPNAVMQTIVGDGITTTVIINEEAITTIANDVIIIRKVTSDGSYQPSDNSFDTSLIGGNFAGTTATGIAAEDIVIDGDGFVTATTSKGPEELVPGQMYDTLDIRVYHRTSDGTGIIGVASYNIDGSTYTFDLPSIPQSEDAVIVKIDNQFLMPTQYVIDYANHTLTFEDSTQLVGSALSIMTIGTNGANLLDTDYFVSDGSTTQLLTGITWTDELSSFVTINGKVMILGSDYSLVKSTTADGAANRIKIVFDSSVLTEGAFVQYSLYNSTVKSYSQVSIDKTFASDGVENYHVLESEPFNYDPISHNIVVKINNRILQPGYSISYTTTSNRVYDIEAWQFDDTTAIDSADVLVFADRVQLTEEQFTYDPVNGRIVLLRNDIATAGSRLDIYIVKNAAYYFLDTNIVFSSNVSTLISVGDTVELTSVFTGDTYTAVAIAVQATEVTFASKQPEIKDAYIVDNEFVVSVGSSSITTQIETVEYVLSKNLTFVIPPSSGETVEIYQFSNHDINNFERITYTVVPDAVIPIDSPDYIKRNLISSGYIPLRGNISSANYAWVAVNEVLLTPNVDYALVESKNAIQLVNSLSANDVVDVIQFGNTPITQRFGYRIFKDMLNRTHYKRLNQKNSYVLASPLNWYDVRILLDDVTGMFVPNRAQNIPGVVFVEGERIEYFEINGNALLQLRRGTLGTGVKDIYATGTIAQGQGPNETVNYNDNFLIQTIRTNDSTTTTEYSLNFVPQSVNEIEVFVAGRRLRKTTLSVYNAALNLDSNEADVVLPAEYTVNNGNLILAIAPPNDVDIRIVRKLGRTWVDSGESLTTSENSIARFLREATIQLPK